MGVFFGIVGLFLMLLAVNLFQLAIEWLWNKWVDR